MRRLSGLFRYGLPVGRITLTYRKVVRTFRYHSEKGATMQFMWVLHLVTVAGLVGLLVYVRRRRVSRDEEERVTACLNVVETRSEAMERFSESYRRKMDEGLKRLNLICDKANTLVERGFGVGTFPPSFEERELRTLVPDERHEIPTLIQVEQTQSRLRDELTLDNESVLREQLG